MTNYFQPLINSNKLYLNFKEVSNTVDNSVFSHIFQESNGMTHKVMIWCHPITKTQQSNLTQWCVQNAKTLNNKVSIFSYIRENNFLPQILDFTFNCSCGTNGLCKHALFSFFILGEKFKQDVKLLLDMRRICVEETVSTVMTHIADSFINKINNAPKERILDESIFDKILNLNED